MTDQPDIQKQARWKGALVAATLALGGATPAWAGQEADEAVIDPADCVPRAALDAYVNAAWERRITVFDASNFPQGEVIFLGSSIIAEGPWDHLYPDTTVINMGINADTTAGLLRRLDQVLDLKPRKVFLYIGGNDFSIMGDDAESAATRLSEIILRINATLPETDVYVHTLLGREGQYSDVIRDFNQQLDTALSQVDAEILDVNPLFTTEAGTINPEYSNDRIHLSGEAYRIWADFIRTEVEG